MTRNIPVKVDLRGARDRFRAHKQNALNRGIAFNFTFTQWTWIEIGHWHERGCRAGQYVMSRFNDRGPYEIGNVRIITAEQNVIEREFSADARARISASLRWHKTSAETRVKLSAAALGRKLSAVTRAKMSVAKLAYWRGRAQQAAST